MCHYDTIKRVLQLAACCAAGLLQECLQMELLSESQLHRPPEKALEIAGPLVQRQVGLCVM